MRSALAQLALNLQLHTRTKKTQPTTPCPKDRGSKLNRELGLRRFLSLVPLTKVYQAPIFRYISSPWHRLERLKASPFTLDSLEAASDWIFGGLYFEG